jgi:DNA-binding transcriptional regulator YdaS (Cro superfamily)
MSEESESPRDRAVRLAGGVSKLAAELGVTRSAVSQWDVVPMDRVFDVARIAGIPAHEIRPDRIPAPTSDVEGQPSPEPSADHSRPFPETTPKEAA